jgi:hypothetical protein
VSETRNFAFPNLVVIKVDRVQWFRDRAKMQRWEEELEILQAEFRRTIRSFERMGEVWTQLAKLSGFPIGYASYAFKQSQIYHEMADNCIGKFKAVGGTWPDPRPLSEILCQQRLATHP